jgi:N-glycosylase/DNA lyase
MKNRINSAIEAICKDIEQKEIMHWRDATEERLLFELVLAILGSQNRYEVALGFAEEIKKQKLLTNNLSISMEELTQKIQTILSSAIEIEGSLIRYRFPNAKAKYIAYDLMYLQKIGGLKSLLAQTEETTSLRAFFVKEIKGIGPKQSSHFLRNVGYTNEVAVLDVHILRYMHIQGIIEDTYMKAIGTLKQYEKIESLLMDFLRYMKYPIGLIDQAIWIVMRVYQRDYAKWQ